MMIYADEPGISITNSFSGPQPPQIAAASSRTMISLLTLTPISAANNPRPLFHSMIVTILLYRPSHLYSAISLNESFLAIPPAETADIY